MTYEYTLPLISVVINAFTIIIALFILVNTLRR